MNDALRRLYDRGPTLPADYIGNVLKIRDERAELVARITGGISAAEAELIAGVAAEVNPRISLEIGLGYGFSALAICGAPCKPRAPRRHIVIDPHQNTYWRGRGIHHLREAGYGDIIELHERPSYRVLPELESQELRIDFAFVDGWHTFDFVIVDFFYVDKMLRKGGVIAFDDADWPSIRPVLRYIVSNLPYSVVRTLPEKKAREGVDVELGLEGSCIALRKEADGDTRDVFHHRPF